MTGGMTGRKNIKRLHRAINEADAIVVGAGAGLSAAAGLTYSGKRFERLFGDFAQKYGIHDMYSGGFFPFPTIEEQWAWWSRHIWCNRYESAPKNTYSKLLRLLDTKDFFVLTTNVDHQFQLAGFPKERLFYTQGDYGLWQCSKPCHHATYDNYDTVKRMVKEQKDMRIPRELVPLCPRCGRPMAMNLRADSTFVEDSGWHKAAMRYNAFFKTHQSSKVLYLELGVGGNTPAIIKCPFWHYVDNNPDATYACVNHGETYTHQSIQSRSILIDSDIDAILDKLLDDEER